MGTTPNDAQGWEPYLRPTFFINSDHPDVVAFTRAHTSACTGPTEQAVALFRAVRDGIRYDPYCADLRPEALRASATLARGASFCVPKAILYAASLRHLGIPSRLSFADVTNHLATRRLRDLLRTDVFAFHGITEVLLGGKWRKATPAFHTALCRRFRVEPLEFDGEHDAVLQSCNAEGRAFLHYLRDRGSYADLPYGELIRVWRETYPHLFAADVPTLWEGDFDAEATREA